MSESWIKLSLPSKFFVAGDRLSGELFSCIYEKDTKIMIKIMGEEQVSIDSPTSKTNHSASIFTLHKEFNDPSSKSHSVFPFNFQIPDYAPASFHFLDTDSQNNIVSAEVFYILEAELYYSGEVITKDTIEITVFLKNFKEAYEKSSNSCITRLKSCCCVPRGRSTIAIQLHSEEENERKFEVVIESENNKKLFSVIVQVVLDVKLIVHDKNLFVRKVVNRKVMTPSILAFTNDGRELRVDYEAKVDGESIGPNVATNNAKFFSSKFYVQVLAMYDIGFHSTQASCIAPLFVNPVPVKNESLRFPSDWSLGEQMFETPKVSSGSSYNTISDD